MITLQYLGSDFSGPGPEDWVQGPQKVAGPDLDQTVDSLGKAALNRMMNGHLL